MLIPEQTKIEKPIREHSSTIIFFHGMTLNNNCVGHFNSQMQAKFPHTKFIFPQASRKEWKVAGMFGCYNKEVPVENTNWYCIKGERSHLFLSNPPQNVEEVKEWGKGVEVNDEHLRSLVFEVHKLIRAEIDSGIKPENIVVAGWSQGGSAALASGLTFEKPLGGIVSLSSFLPWSPRTLDLLNNASLEKKKMPIIFCNGTDDGLVPFWTGEMSAKILKLCGFSKTDFHGYQNQGHSTNCDNELNDFLEKVLVKKRKEFSEKDDVPACSRFDFKKSKTDGEGNNVSFDDCCDFCRDMRDGSIKEKATENSHQLLVDDIKKRINDFEITSFVDYSVREKEVGYLMLVHSSASYNKKGCLVNNPEMYNRDLFSDEEWSELEKLKKDDSNSRVSENVLTNQQLKNLTKKEIVDLIERLDSELKKREAAKSGDNTIISKDKELEFKSLEEQKKASEKFLNSLNTRTSKSPTDHNNNSFVSPLIVFSIITMLFSLGFITYQVRKSKIKR